MERGIRTDQMFLSKGTMLTKMVISSPIHTCMHIFSPRGSMNEPGEAWDFKKEKYIRDLCCSGKSTSTNITMIYKKKRAWEARI